MKSILKTGSFTLALIIAASLAVTSCGKKHSIDDDLAKEEQKSEGGGGGGAMGESTIKGTVEFEGTAPNGTVVSQESDPVCKGKMSAITPEVSSDVVVNNGKVQNVFVYVSGGGISGTYDPPAEPAVLDQDGCRYHPHVLGVVAGQKIKIKNSDPTMHNVHASPSANSQFNVAQPNQGAENEKSFEKEEVMVPISCDVHGWMRSYVGVMPHPFFGVSGADGGFSISKLPPGKYTVTAWHEKFGTQKQEVEVTGKDSKEIKITFKAQ